MNFDTAAVSRVALGAVPALATVLGLLRGPSGPRRHLERDIKLHDALPEDNGGRTVMAEWIEQQVQNLRNFESDATRDISGAVIAFLLTVGLGAGTYWLIGHGTWWSYAVAPIPGVFALVGLTEISDRVQIARRDKDGKKLPD